MGVSNQGGEGPGRGKNSTTTKVYWMERKGNSEDCLRLRRNEEKIMTIARKTGRPTTAN